MKIRHVLLGSAGVWVLYLVVIAASTALGGMTYFHFGNPQHTCASCHEMSGVHSDWSASAHRTLHCRECHGGSLTLDVHALRSHINRVVQHFTGDPARPIRLAERDVLRAHESCRNCHPQAYADWQSSRHTTTYERIFLHPDHNRAELPADDCLRCHGMFFDGEMAALVAPLNKTGPWKLKDPAKAAQPAIPCLACHQIHTPAGQSRPPHFYDRREQAYFTADLLPVATIRQAGQAVKVSLDPRQRLCVQCHAPSAKSGHQLGSSDDRTPVGVHAGLSCLDCHRAHTSSARDSCAACHPANSHCGLDVEKMDTTHLSLTSRHNIHSVACQDCHPRGIPKKTRPAD